MTIREDHVLQELRRRSPQALELLMNEYSGVLYSLASRIMNGLGSPQDLEECISDVFVEAWNKSEEYDEHRGSVRTWLLILTKYKALDYRRRLSKRTGVEAMKEDLPSRDESVEQTVLSYEDSQAVIYAVNELPEPDRQIVFQRYFLYEPLEAIAERYSMTKKAVENRLYRSRVQLRSKLSLWFKEETSHDG
ncbi:sigma-70 family RNA polymerase sigma factor [Paenibacillus silviterrae]|uniref:sigma-70 family RNA polymerase sigma factor n=1 Tax=Paenibacillus silviterrae TaxID=3242194 RepID=UPI002542A1A5|nr:sigma-70 family RNA polymerase sigma factor [Paenibacillus chinjuensis]